MKLIILTTVLALVGPAYSENRTVDTEDIPLQHRNITPTPANESLTWISHHAEPNFLFLLQVGAGAPSRTREFLEQLVRVANNSDVELHFGLHYGEGHINAPNGMSVEVIALSSSKCSAICRPNDRNEINRFDLSPWLPGPRGTSISDSRGICGELSVAHGLVDRTVVDPRWVGITRGKFWNDSYVHRVWQKAGSNTNGTTIAEQKKAFQADWNTVWANQCSGATVPSQGFLGIGGTSVRSWCESLGARVRKKNDACIFGLNGGGTKRRSGHAMYALDAKWTGSKCVVQVVNTGRQGSPIGVNVPRHPGNQTWEVAGSATKQVIRHTAGTNGGFWNGMRYQSVDAVCCDEEPKWWPDRPERKGKAWK